MPDLTVIAGCNGAGKSTFASSFLSDGLRAFDYDKTYLENYNSLPDSELRDVIAKNRTTLHSPELKAFILKHSDLFWYMP